MWPHPTRAASESRAHFSCTGISCHINTFLVGFSYFSCFSLSSTLLNRSLLRDDVPKAPLGRSRTCPVGAFPVLQSRFALALDQARSLKLLQSLLRPQELLYSIRDLQKSHSNIRDCGFVGFSRAFGMEEKKTNKKKADGEKILLPAPLPPGSAPRGARGRVAIAEPTRRCRPTPPAAAPREEAAELGLPRPREPSAAPGMGHRAAAPRRPPSDEFRRVPNLNLLSFSLKATPLVPSLLKYVKSHSASFFLSSFQVL